MLKALTVYYLMLKFGLYVFPNKIVNPRKTCNCYANNYNNYIIINYIIRNNITNIEN